MLFGISLLVAHDRVSCQMASHSVLRL